jgi:hypothetical protein
VTEIHPELADRGSFAHLPLGRVAPRHDPRTLRLAKYLDDAVVLPEIPVAADYAAAVSSWPMYGNDRLGDCTCAAAGHMVEAWSAAAAAPVVPVDADVEALYWATGSGDTGRFEVDILNYWRGVGLGGDKIAAYAYVNPQNLDHVRAAIYLFGGLYAGIALPESAQGQQVWDVAGDGKTGQSQPGSWGGHAVPYVGFGDGRIALVTWGAVLEMTEAFHLAYCDELYVVISPDFLAAGKTPQGFDLAALEADLAAVTADAAVPAEGNAAGAEATTVAQDPGGFTWNG